MKGIPEALKIVSLTPAIAIVVTVLLIYGGVKLGVAKAWTWVRPNSFWATKYIQDWKGGLAKCL
jgi:hypothetical protein